MYPVSDAFLSAVRSNTRKYFWTGTIVTKGGMTYEFGAKEIVKGSGYISRQCCGSTEIELGTVYAAEMGITLLSDIDRYTLEDAQVTLVFHLVLADDSVEDVPMGVFGANVGSSRRTPCGRAPLTEIRTCGLPASGSLRNESFTFINRIH